MFLADSAAFGFDTIPIGMDENSSVHVLLVEDDERLGSLTIQYLRRYGFVVTWVTTGPQALDRAGQRTFDVVLLDLMLPGLDGMEVCRVLRRRTSLPIIVVTARDDEEDRVLGLDGGADDYVTKPFSARELVSRIRALVRRSRAPIWRRTTTVAAGNIVIDAERRRVWVFNRAVDLTGQEFSLLFALACQAGRVLSREQLMVYAGTDDSEAFDRSIDVQISRLRKKLGDNAKEPRYVKTVRGAGYVLLPRGQ